MIDVFRNSSWIGHHDQIIIERHCMKTLVFKSRSVGTESFQPAQNNCAPLVEDGSSKFKPPFGTIPHHFHGRIITNRRSCTPCIPCLGSTPFRQCQKIPPRLGQLNLLSIGSAESNDRRESICFFPFMISQCLTILLDEVPVRICKPMCVWVVAQLLFAPYQLVPFSFPVCSLPVFFECFLGEHTVFVVAILFLILPFLIIKFSAKHI
mmetsp:Transcript_93964/g.180650  ORF Transcript_93964/g.180650 Transcript_93964/m.180650 type:complete len:208 (-) Transcript_93964:329-952(-)